MSRRSDAGSVLMLVPAGILVLFLLASIAVDAAIVQLAERDLADRTAAAANDLATVAVSDDALYGRGDVAIDEERARDYVRLAFDPNHPPEGYQSWSADVRAAGRSITVDASAEVRYLFAGVVPGGRRSTTVHARSTATARGG